VPESQTVPTTQTEPGQQAVSGPPHWHVLLPTRDALKHVRPGWQMSPVQHGPPLMPQTAQNPSRSHARFAVLQPRWSDDPQHVSSRRPHRPVQTPSLQVKPGWHDPSAQQSWTS
jgi:hypothetical protein